VISHIQKALKCERILVDTGFTHEENDSIRDNFSTMPVIGRGSSLRLFKERWIVWDGYDFLYLAC
jgi:hypothetical protein